MAGPLAHATRLRLFDVPHVGATLTLKEGRLAFVGTSHLQAHARERRQGVRMSVGGSLHALSNSNGHYSHKQHVASVDRREKKVFVKTIQN